MTNLAIAQMRRALTELIMSDAGVSFDEADAMLFAEVSNVMRNLKVDMDDAIFLMYRGASKTRSNRQRREEAYRESFGSGGPRSNGRGMLPVHAVTADGKPVTVGIGSNDHVFVSSGHRTFDQFYGRQSDGKKGHDHILSDGKYANGGDRGRTKL